MSDNSSTVSGRVLVTDFDGTMTRRDFFQIVVEKLLPAGTPDYWSEYLAGRLTHFEALKAIFGSVTAGEPALIDVVNEMELDPNLKGDLEALQLAGWRVVVASAGCQWYIERLLAQAGVTLEVHANPGHIEGGRLVMEPPLGSRYFSPQTGVDKVALVRAAMVEAPIVAYAGDGRPDLAPALVVPGSLRFARGVLAAELTRLGEDFWPFDRWSGMSRALLQLG